MRTSFFIYYAEAKKSVLMGMGIIYALVSSHWALAQDKQQSPSISLSEQSLQARSLSQQVLVGPFIQEALKYNPSLQAADRQFQAAQASIKSAGVLPNPKIQLSHFVESVQTRTGPQEQAIMLQQDIPWPSKLSRKKDIARAHAQALWYAAVHEQFKVVERVAKGIFDIAYLEKSREISETHLALLQQLESIVQTRVESGGDLNQLLRLQVEVAQAEDLLAQQTAQIASKTTMLSALVGKEVGDKHLNLTWQVPQPIRQNKSLWLDAVMDQSPQMRMLQALENNHDARLRLAKLVNRPNFSLGVNRIMTGEALNPQMEDSGKDPWAIMIGISLPLWQKANKAEIKRANFSKQAVSAELAALALQLKATSRSHIIRLDDAEQRLTRYQTKIIPLAKQARDIAESSYLTGKADMLSVIDSNRSLLNLQQQYWRVAADAWTTRWQLATLSGGLWLN